MKTSIPRSLRIILPLLCGVAVLLLASPARAQIALVDNEMYTNSAFNSASTFMVLKTNLTVSASANTLVVVVTFRDNTAAIETPSTLGWTNATVSQTLTRLVQIESKAASGGRCSAIYYLYGPTAGTGFNINGKLSGQAGSSGDLVAYTLSGVDTSVVPPPSGAASQSQGAAVTTFSTTINNITANSWAAVGGVIGEADTTHTIAASNGGTATGTPNLTIDTPGFSSASTAAMGYISAIAGGSDLFTYTFAPSVNADGALAVAIFAPTATPAITTQPQNASAFSGGSGLGVFSVAANGTSLSYQWYSSSSSTLPLVNAVALTGATKYSGATASTLIVSNVVAADLTNYAVVVTGSSVSVTSSVVSLASVPLQNQLGDVISVNMTFTTAYESTALTLNPTDLAGAVPVTNWVNYIANTSWPVSQGTNVLYDDAGANTGAGLTMAGVDNGFDNTASSLNSASTPNAKLLHDVLVLRNGVTDTLTFTNLPAIGNYDVYVYLSGQDNNDQLAVQCLNNGVTYYQEALGTAITNNQVLLQGNNTTSGTYPICNYVVFGGVTPAASGGSISFAVSPSPLSGNNGGVAGVQLVPSGATFLGFIQQPQTATIAAGQNATFTASAVGNPAVSSYQWYAVGGGVTNLIAGATSSSYTTNAPATSGTSYFVVAGNGGSSITSSVAGLNLFTSGIWSSSSGGSWNTPANWVGSLTANGVSATAWFTNGSGGTVTLDNAAGFTTGTNIFGTNSTLVAPAPWVINSGTPAGTLTLAANPAVPTSVISGGSSDTVSGVPVITVTSNNLVTVNAPLAGNQGLYVNGNGTLVLAGGNTNSTYSGSTVIGTGNLDTTSLQIGSGGASGAIDFVNPIYMAGYAHLIFNRSDTVTVSSIFENQPGKAPNVIVNSGTVIVSPSAVINSWLGAVVNNGGKLVLDCPASVYFVANSGGTVNITNGTPAASTNGASNGGNSGGVSLGINSGGTVQLAGPGGNGVNIKNDGEGVLNNGTFDLGGDAIQVGFVAGSGVVTNTGATLATLTLMGAQANTAYPWSGTIADGVTAKTAVTTSAGTTVFNGANTYTGPTLVSGTLMLSNSASLASANIYVNGANLILVGTPTITNPNATVFVGSGRTLNLAGMTGNFTLNAGQTLVVTNTGFVSSGVNSLIAASGSTLVPGGYGTAGTMTNYANLTLNGNTNVFDLATASTEGSGVNDEIIGVTNLTLSGNITIQVNTNFNNSFSAATSYKLIKYTGTLANTATFTVSPATLGGNLATISTATAGYVQLTIAGNSASSLSATATNIDAFTGYPVTLSVAEAGSLPITNQWFNGASPVSGATNLSYTFTPVTPGVYTYTLYATNAFGTAHQAVNVIVGSPTISVQCALNTGYFAGSLYLAPTDTAGVYGVSNWNVISVSPGTPTAAGISSTTLVDANGFATPATFTAVNVQDGWHEKLTITNTDTANARMMNTYWYANPAHTPSENAIGFTFTNLPNDDYDVFVYVLQQVSPDTGGGNVAVYDGSFTNYVFYGESFGSTSNFITGINTTGTGTLPYASYVMLQLSTGGSNSLSFTESGLTAGVGGSGVPGVQIMPATAPVANNNTYSRNGLKNWMIQVNNLLTNATDADGATLTLYSVGASTNGITPVITTGSPAYVSYYNTNLVDDKFGYTVTNGFGRSSSGTITLLAGMVGGGASGQISGIAFTNGVASMSFAGIPGYTYNVQVSTNLTSWNTIWTTNAPAGGVFQFNDSAAPMPDAYYRLMWNGN